MTDRDYCPRCGSPFFFAHPGCPVCYKLSPLYLEPTVLDTYRATHRFGEATQDESGVSVR